MDISAVRGSGEVVSSGVWGIQRSRGKYSSVSARRLMSVQLYTSYRSLVVKALKPSVGSVGTCGWVGGVMEGLGLG
jgi:hypothetical protein